MVFLTKGLSYNIQKQNKTENHNFGQNFLLPYLASSTREESSVTLNLTQNLKDDDDDDDKDIAANDNDDDYKNQIDDNDNEDTETQLNDEQTDLFLEVLDEQELVLLHHFPDGDLQWLLALLLLYPQLRAGCLGEHVLQQ